MRVRSIVGTVGTVSLAAVVLAASAQAAVTIAITSPSAGETVSRSAMPELEVTGIAGFAAPIPASRTFYLRREQCASGNDDARLTLVKGSKDVNGCSFIAQPANEVLHRLGDALFTTYSASDGIPVTMGAGKVTGVIRTGGSFGLPAMAGQSEVDVRLTGLTADGESKTLISKTYTSILTPAQSVNDVVIDEAVPADAVESRLVALSLDVTLRGAQVGNGSITMNGASFLTLPILDTGTVLVSTVSTFSASKTVTAELGEDGSWTALVETPLVGSRTIYARAVQGSERTTASVPITVVS